MNHPNHETLRNYLSDLLQDSQDETVSQHLQDCADCQSTLEALISPTTKIRLSMFEQNAVTVKLSTKADSHENQDDCDSNDCDSKNGPVEIDLPEFGAGHRYIVLGKLASGGMATVYRGFDRELKREVAIKVSTVEDCSSSSARFNREAQISGQLQHPGIVPVHELGRLKDGRLYIAMKLVEGQTLLDLIRPKQTNGLSPKLLEIFGIICQTMAYAHSRNFIHRDLKPENIMVGTFGEVQIMDWGLGKKLRWQPKNEMQSHLDQSNSNPHRAAPTLRSPGQTLPGVVFGTPAYMPPEQARGELATKRADVFAMGGILYQILTGRPPFIAATMTKTLAKSVNSDLAQVYADLDESNADQELVSLAKTCLATDPQQRPEDAVSVNQLFTNYTLKRDQRLQASRLEEARSKERLLAQQKRNRQIVVSSAAIIVSLLTAAIAGFSYLNEKNTRIADQAKQEREELEQQVAQETSLRESMANAKDFRDLAVVESEQAAENWILATSEIEKATPIAEQLPESKLKAAFVELEKSINEGAAKSQKMRAYLESERICYEEVKRCCIESTYHPQVRPYVDYRVLSRLKAAYKEIEVVPGKMSVATIKRLAESEHKTDLLFGLQTWLKELLNFCDAESEATKDETVKWLLHLIALIDPEPFRMKVREALGANDFSLADELLLTEAAVDSLATIRTCSSYLPVMKDKEAALAYLYRAQQRFPMDFHINWNLAGVGDIVSNRYDDRRNISIQHTLVSYSLQPEHPNVLLNLGATYVQDGKSEMAIEVLEKLARVAPTFPMTYLNLAHAYLDVGQLEDALEHCNKVLELTNQRAPHAMALRGEIHYQLNDTSAAIRDTRQALELNPTMAYVHENLANMYEVDGQLEKAIESLLHASKLEPQSKNHRDGLVEFNLSLYQKHREAQQYAKAAEHLTNAIKIQPSNIKLTEQLGNLYVVSEQWGQAEVTFKSILKADKRNSYAVASLANLYLAQDRPSESEELIRTYIFDGVNSHTMQLELAKALLAQAGEPNAKQEEAIEILKRLSKLAPRMNEPKRILSKL